MKPPIETRDPYQAELDTLQAEGHLRRCRTMAGGAEVLVEINPSPNPLPQGEGAKLLVNFSHNNYLGLAQDDRLKRATMDAIERHGVGSGGSRLIGGTSLEIVALEAAVAEFKQAESALVFNSGYQANVSILPALLGPGDWVFCDRLNHASLVDGCRLSGARWTRYHHLDWQHLEKKLKQAPAGVKKWIVTDSVFSMDGDLANLNVLADLAGRWGAYTLVDEAHATGIFGEDRSSGLCEAEGVSAQITLQMGTFSKALGGQGAYVAGPKALIQTLVNKARGFVYSTAPPPGVIAAAHKAIEVVQADPEPKRRLWENIRHFHAQLRERGVLPGERAAQSPIFSIILGDSDKAMAASRQLLEAGYFVQAIRPPTVPTGTARLRVTVSAHHSPEQLAGLAEALSTLIPPPLAGGG